MSTVLVHPDDRVTRPMWCVLSRLRARPIAAEDWTVRAIVPTHEEAERLETMVGATFETRLQVAIVTIDMRGAQ